MSGGLTTALLAATSGLRAAQAGLDVVSRNIANATTVGYTRKILPQTPLIVGGQGQGVRVGEVERYVDSRMQREARTYISATEVYRVMDDFLGQLELAMGQPGDNASFAYQLNSLGDAFRALAAMPSSSSAQATVISRARSFATGINDVANLIQNLRTDADAAIAIAVDTVNSTLAAIKDLNQQIGLAQAMGQSTADLEDRRDVLLDRLSELIDIRYFKRDSGEIWITTNGGRPLLDTSLHTLSFTNSPAVNAGMTYEPPPAVSALSGVMLDGTIDITSEIGSGRIRGLLNLRDDALVTAQKQLDELAARVAVNFALRGLDLFDIEAESALITGNSPGAAAAVGATSFTDPGAGSVAVGMLLKFSNHDTIYTVTNIIGTTIEIAPVNGGTGLQASIGPADSIIYVAMPTIPGYASRISVNDAVVNEPWRVRDGTVVPSENPNLGDTTLVQDVINMFDRVQAFTPSIGLGSSATLVGYANSIIAFQANERANNKDLFENKNALTDALKDRIANDSGVNVDRELALMIELQNSYAANAKVIQAAREMLDALLNIV